MDDLIRLPLIKYDVKERNITRVDLAESYGVNKLYCDTPLLTYQTIDKYQRKEKEQVEKLKHANYHTKYSCGGGNIFMLIFKNDKIVVPTILQKYVVNWYHTYLLHTGTEYTEATIIQHYYWNKLREDIRTHIKVCDTFQKNKKPNLTYGKLPAKEAEAIPWDRLLVDIILPYKIRI